MDIKQIEQLLEIALEYRKEDLLKQKATEEYFSAVFPDNYAPMLDNNKLEGLLEAIKIINKYVCEEFEYYIYEAPNLKECIVTNKDWEEYDYTKSSEMLRFIKENIL